MFVHVYGAVHWCVEGAEEGFEVHGAGFAYTSLHWTVTRRFIVVICQYAHVFLHLTVCWSVEGAEEGFEVHGAGCQRICSCSGRDHRQSPHPRHPAAQRALPLPVGNVQGPFRGMPFPVQPLKACSQTLCGVDMVNMSSVPPFVIHQRLICHSVPTTALIPDSQT